MPTFDSTALARPESKSSVHLSFITRRICREPILDHSLSRTFIDERMMETEKPQMEILRVTYHERNNFTVDIIGSHGSVSDGAVYVNSG